MPEQQSKRANPVTGASFEAPFETQIVRLGVGGLNLKDAIDAVPAEQFTRLTNADHDLNAGLTSRPGQIASATAGTRHHSVRRLDRPSAGTTTRIWGIDSSLYGGASGALTLIEGGYSGDPLSLVPHRPPLSGDPWMFVADRSRMRKIRASDLLSLPIGLPAPVAACTVAPGIQYKRLLVAFDGLDGTDANAWSWIAGTDENGHPTGIPNAVDEASSPAGPDVYFTTDPGSSIDAAYDSWFAVAVNRDGSTLAPVSGGGGSLPATDDDLVHLWIKTARPQFIREIRLYLCVNAGFDQTDSKLPGTPGGVNTDAYVKGFRQNDFVQFIQAVQTQVDAAETARIFALRDQDLEARATSPTDDRASWADARAVTDPGRGRALQIGAGAEQWFELGSIGLPFRRGDFQRIGNTPGRDWSTITGCVVYIKIDITDTERVGSFAMDDLYVTGGFGPDTADPGQQPYDWRVTHYDPRTGAESNLSPEMAAAAVLDALRSQFTVTPAAPFGDTAMRQRIYRRGGSNFTEWDFCGVNTSDGGAFTDTLTDDALAAAGAGPADHFQPVPTIDAAGATVLAQPVAALWGPIEGMLLACGDPYRPGHLYWSLPDSPDHWSATSNKEICPPSEELMHGGLVGNQAFVFSRRRLYLLYPSLTGEATIDYAPSGCTRGIATRTAFCVGPLGIYFVAQGEGVFTTTGGPEEWLSRDVDPLFQGVAKNGYLPIDWDAGVVRLTVWENKLFLLYQDTGGQRQVLIYHLLLKFWRHATFTRALDGLQGDQEDTLLLGGLSTGTTYLHDGTADDGVAIAAVARTGAFSGGRREEKLFGDQILDADANGVTVTVQNFLNEETLPNASQAAIASVGRTRQVLDVFGTSPQLGRSISTQLHWSTAQAPPTCFQIGYGITLQPEITQDRVTNWDDLGSSDEVWLSGITLDVDTAGDARTVLVERDYAGVRDTVATLTVQSSGRHKFAFSWAAVPARQVRLRPTDQHDWLLYRAEWIYQVEPPRIAAWDIHFENRWDQYYTGLDLYCDTSGATKQIEVSVDGTVLNDPATGLPWFPCTANGRRVVHLTLPWGRGHVFRFRAIDANVGLLYSHRWHLDPEPSEQANWNQNFSIYGTRADKWLKAVIFECDTFGQNKAVTVEADGVVVETLTVNANGRKVVQLALTTQHLGRVWRLFPVDGNPGRLYSAQPIFDEEPFQLTRWETQETNYGLPGWFTVLSAQIVLKSTLPVTLTLTRQQNQRGLTVTETYTIPATGGVKIRAFQTFKAGKDVLHKWVLTSAAAFFLYKEETVVALQAWPAGADALQAHPFGSDDQDPTRAMKNAVAAAFSSGGALDESQVSG